ncbi:MAG: hypothetical protein R3E56_21950, partial [Burkholderiaceae bacterium]
MAGLTTQDMEILKNYAEKGNRELYWNYLAQTPGNDGYGLLALGVVRNDNMPGALANQYAQNQAQSVNGVRMSERQWDAFGQDLMRRDYEFRQAHFDNGEAVQALNLPVKEVQIAHDQTFGDAGITPDAWTPRPLLEAARRHGGEPAAEGVWQTMLDSQALGTKRLVATLSDTAYRYNDEGLPAARYVGQLTLATAAASQTLPNTNPEQIGSVPLHHDFDAREGAWYSVNSVAAGMGAWNAIRRETDPARIRELNDTRALRQEVQERARDFHPLDPHRTLAKSPKTLADGSDTHAPTRHAANLTGSDDATFERLTEASMTQDAEGKRVATQVSATSAEAHELSPHAQNLLNDCQQQVWQLSQRHGLPWDQGMENTVAAIAHHARADGLTGINQFHVNRGQICYGQYDGYTLK